MAIIRDMKKAEKDGYVIEMDDCEDGAYPVFKTLVSGKYYFFSLEKIPEETRKWLAKIVTNYLRDAYTRGMADKEKEISDKWRSLFKATGNDDGPK